MEVEFTLTAEDVIAFRRYHAEHPPKGRRGRQGLWVMICFFGLLTLMAVPFGVLQGERSFRSLFPPCALAVLLFLQFGGGRRLAEWAVRRSFKNSEKARGLRTQRIMITPEAIIQTMEFATGVHDWAGVEGVAATEDHAFVFLTQTRAFVVPKRAFASEREFLLFVDTAQRYHKAASGT